LAERFNLFVILMFGRDEHGQLFVIVCIEQFLEMKGHLIDFLHNLLLIAVNLHI